MSGTASALARALVRRRTQAQMTCRIVVLRGALGVLDPGSGQVGGITGARTVYAGRARIRTVAPAGTIGVGDAQVDVRSTVISIPIASPVPHRDDLVRVDEAGDLDLDTRIFRVTDVDGGGAFGDARRLYCTAWHESRYWGAQ